MQNKLASGVIAFVITIALSGLASVGTDSSARSGSDDVGCEDLFSYRNDFFATFNAYPEFLTWWADNTSPIDSLKPDEAEALLEQGVDFVNDVEDLDVPTVYEDGNAGVAGLYGWFNDLIAWVVLEEGAEPDTDDLADAMSQLKKGEEAAAENCAEEVADFGGYVLVDPAGIDEDEVPEDPGDVDKGFL